MKNSFRLTIVFLLLSHSIFAQQKRFSDGYIIDNAGKRSDGFIRVSDLESINNENAAVDFMTSLEGQSTKMPASEFSEIGIGNDIRYQKILVPLDDSDINTNISYDRNFNFIPKTLFLNVLIDGAATLYSYESNMGTKYFYKLKNGTAVTQLRYKKYYVGSSESSGKTLREITEFRQQLSKDVSCTDDPFSKYSNLNYDKTSLIAIFTAYNNCQNSDAVVFKNEKKSGSKTKFTVFAGVSNMTVQISNRNPEPAKQSALSYNVGAELELGKSSADFGLFGRLELEKGTTTTVSTTLKLSEFSDDVLTARYKFEMTSLNVLVGGRYHMSDFFADAAIGFNLGGAKVGVNEDRTSSGSVFSDFEVYKAKPAVYFSFGVGYNLTTQFGVRLRLDTPKIIDDNEIKVKYSQIGLNLRYSFK